MAQDASPASDAPRGPRDHLPPLVRGIGLSLVLVASLVVGVAEHRSDRQARERLAVLAAHAGDARAADAARPADAVAAEIRDLRLQLQDHDLADRVFENPWFQLLGLLGSALVAASFLYEARLKWPGRTDP